MHANTIPKGCALEVLQGLQPNGEWEKRNNAAYSGYVHDAVVKSHSLKQAAIWRLTWTRLAPSTWLQIPLGARLVLAAQLDQS